jgi:N-methylhydantoinase A
MTFRLGVDIGGTFTDFCLFDDANGSIHTCKVLSTPDEPGAEILAGLEELHRRYGVAPHDIAHFTHGTTVGVNTIIQRKGAPLCLIATSGFEDVLEVARLKMPDPYSLFSRRALPLVPREQVFGIVERSLANGDIDTPVEAQSVICAIDGIREVGGRGVVVSLLHAYRNPANEQAVKIIIEREAPDLTVSCSSEIWPIIREYERTVTAVVASYALPRMRHYLTSLEGALHGAGVPATPMITKSNGGVMSTDAAKRECAQVLLSGTASGVIGAGHVALQAGILNTMSLDIGGTSADVAFIRDGAPSYGVGELIGEFPIYIPTVAVTSIGEGGGSVAWVDDFGVLKVGPHSAGSTPGPACYARGGTEPTITDAFVVCGFLGQSTLGYSAVALDQKAAHEAVTKIATKLGRDLYTTAQNIIEVAVSGMYLEVSKLLSRYGVDAGELTLQPFGGAGPMLGNFVARELGMKSMVIPTTPGVLSAFGGLIADIKGDFIRTMLCRLDATSLHDFRREVAALCAQGHAWLEDMETGLGAQGAFEVCADMRYHGQSFEIETPWEQAWLEHDDTDVIAHAFHRQHESIYGHSDLEAPIEVVNLRVVARCHVPKPQNAAVPTHTAPAAPARTMRVWIDGTHHDAAVYDRTTLLAGHSFFGPAIVEQADCTTCLLPGAAAHIDSFGNLVVAL